MAYAELWLPIFGAGIFICWAVGAWYGGNRVFAVWLALCGIICLLLLGTLQIQHALEQHETPKRDDARAYVFVTDGSVDNPEGGKVTVAVNIRNTGQTPALELTWRAKFEVRMVGEEHKIALAEDPGVKQTLPPGESLSYKYTFPTWDPRIDALLAAETAAIFAVGEIRYKDRAGVSHFTDYLLKSGGRFGISTGISPGRFGTVDIKSD